MILRKLTAMLAFASHVPITASSFPNHEIINTTFFDTISPQCTPAEAGQPQLVKEQCRAALTNFVRAHRAQPDWIFTQDDSRFRTPGYITVPLFAQEGHCLIIYDIPQRRECNGNIARVIRFTNYIIDECIGMWTRGFNGGLIFVPATIPVGAFISIYITGSSPHENFTLARAEALGREKAALESLKEISGDEIEVE